MTVTQANDILHRHVSREWYFQYRLGKIWFIEELKNTYNRIFYCIDPDGVTSKEVLDFQLRQAISFVTSRRRPENRHLWDKRGKVVSGLAGDDKEGRQTLPSEIE